jgi:hypothetical protein
MMFFAGFIQNHHCGRPGNIEISGFGLGIITDLDRDKMLIYKFDYLRFRVRNCTHLLAADSARVKKIQQDEFFFGHGPGQPGLKITFPFNFVMHGLPP